MSATSKTCELMRMMSAGESFYLEDEPKVATAYAVKYNVKITTSVCLVIESPSGEAVVVRATKVTLV